MSGDRSARSPYRARALFLLGVLWLAVVVVAYFSLVRALPPLNVQGCLPGIERFFLWQGLAFLVVPLPLALARPRRAGAIAVVYLAASSAVLLASARTPALAAGFVAFAIWFVASLASLRLALRKTAGPAFATWGLAAALLYAIWIPVAFVLGLFHLVYPVVVLALAVALSLPGLLAGSRLREGWRAGWRKLTTLGPIGAAGLEVAWLVLAMAFVWASVHEIGSDSTRVYLPFARTVALTHGFEIQAIDWHRLMPMAVQAVWADALALAGAQAAKWLSWAALAGLAVLVWEEMASRARSRGFASLAAAAVLGCPVLAWLATTLYVDHVIVLLTVAAFASLARCLARRSRRGAVVSALIAGSLAQVKYTAVILALCWAVILAAVAWRRHGWRRGLSWCAPALGVLVLAALPWYGYTAATTGDPVFPFLKRVFPTPYWPGGLSTSLGQERFEGPRSATGWLRFPWTATFRTSAISVDSDGSLGFWLLALLPLALGARTARRSAWSLAAGGATLFVVLAPASVNSRYWLPAYVLGVTWLLAVGAALVRRHPPRVSRGVAGAVALAAALLLALPLPIWLCASWAAYRFPWDVYAGTTSERSRLAELLPGIAGVEGLNARLAPTDRVLVTGDTGVDLVEARSYEFPFWHTLVSGIDSPFSLAAFLAQNRVRYWLVDYTQLDDAAYFASLGAPEGQWSPSRLVAADGTMAAYDVGPAARRTEACAGRETLAPRLGAATGWQGDVDTDGGAGGIPLLHLRPDGTATHGVAVPPFAEIARATVRAGGEPGTTVRATLEWVDETGRHLRTTEIADILPPGLGLVDVTLFSGIPPGSSSGTLSLSADRRIALGFGSVDYWYGIGPGADASLRADARLGVTALFPTAVGVGEVFNPQGGGGSALGVRGRFDAGHKYLIVLNGAILRSPASTGDVVTGVVPAGALNSPGEYEAFVVDTTARAHSRSLFLHVSRGASPPACETWRRTLHVNALYPPEATAGEAINVQPDGSSAMAVLGEFSSATRYEVVLDGRPLTQVTNGGNGLSVLLPPDLARSPGEHEVFVIDPVAMVRSNSLYFALRQPAAKAAPR